MKKILFSTMAVAVMAMSSCGSKTANANVSAEDKALGDSMAIALGQMAGARQYEQFERIKSNVSEAELKNFNKDEFMRGLELVLTADTANIAFLNGLYEGLQLFNPVVGAERETGIPVDPKVVIKAYREIYMGDTLTHPDQYQLAYRMLVTEFQQRAEQKRKDAIANTPEAQETLKAGEDFQKKAIENGFQKTESGLLYKIVNPGTGDKVTKTDRVKIKYVGKHINDSVFDQSTDEGLTRTASSFVPGFAEGLTLVGKGGSATIVIPADLAYGVDGAGDKIKPQETLVFDIEVLDIEK